MAARESEGLPLLEMRNYSKYESVKPFDEKEVLQPADNEPLREPLHENPYYHQKVKTLGPEVFLEPATMKNVPLSAPYGRLKKNRSYGLVWINEFRHWWKWSRLLVRLAGLYSYVQEKAVWSRILSRSLLKKKGPSTTLQLIKRLSQGGRVRAFMKNSQPYTRAVRIVVALWRILEASRCRRREVRLAEFMAFIGNRCSRDLARELCDLLLETILIPFILALIEWNLVDSQNWHPAYFIIIMGVIRAVAPFAFSFQGSRFGRTLSRMFYQYANDRWMPTMRIGDVNMTSDDCCEFEELDTARYNADLVTLAKEFATLLSKDLEQLADPKSCLPSHQQQQHLESAGFHQIGRGCGGYSLYRYRSKDQAVLIHVTPYGPSLYDELPRYVLLEHEGVQDTRGT